MSDPSTNNQLRALIERIERLEEDKKAVTEEIKEVYAEAKGGGFDVKAMREIVRIRRMDAADRAEFEALVDLYRSALGMLADTPLGRAAEKRDLSEKLTGRLVGVFGAENVQTSGRAN